MLKGKTIYTYGLGLGLASLLLLAGCGELKETAGKAAEGVEDVAQSAATSADPQVLLVKDNFLEQYPDQTVGKAFEAYFTSPTWKYVSGEADGEIVEFTGNFLYEEVDAKAAIQFVIQEDDSFEIGKVSYNDLPQNESTVEALLAAIYGEEPAPEKETAAEPAEEQESPETVAEAEPAATEEVRTIEMPVPIGASLADLNSHYGNPTYDDYFMGGRLVVFDEEDGYFLDEAEAITGFMISNPYIRIYDAYVGMTFDEVSAVLAQPAETYYDDVETQSYVSIYQVENYTISFYADTEIGPTTSAIVIDNSAMAAGSAEASSPYEWTPGFQEHFEEEILKRGYVDSLETIRYEEAYVENNEGYLQVYGESGGAEFPIVKVNVKTGDFSGL